MSRYIHSSSSSLGAVANATDVLQPWGLLYNPIPLWLVVPTFVARCLHAYNDARDPSSERWKYVGEKDQEFCLNGDFHAI